MTMQPEYILLNILTFCFLCNNGVPAHTVTRLRETTQEMVKSKSCSCFSCSFSLLWAFCRNHWTHLITKTENVVSIFFTQYKRKKTGTGTVCKILYMVPMPISYFYIIESNCLQSFCCRLYHISILHFQPKHCEYI